MSQNGISVETCQSADACGRARASEAVSPAIANAIYHAVDIHSYYRR
jgi:hypothetical protein